MTYSNDFYCRVNYFQNVRIVARQWMGMWPTRRIAIYFHAALWIYLYVCYQGQYSFAMFLELLLFNCLRLWQKYVWYFYKNSIWDINIKGFQTEGFKFMTYQTITSLRRHLFSIKLCLQKCLGHYDIMDNCQQECLISQST